VSFYSLPQYDKGQVIIKRIPLVAKAEFVSKSNFDEANWEKYTQT
jgi:hypothetical protein